MFGEISRILKDSWSIPFVTVDFWGDLTPSDLQDGHGEKCDDLSKFCVTEYLHASYLKL